MMSNHKQSAIDFLNLIVLGHFDEAYEKYVDMNGKHHNPYSQTGFLGLKDAMEQNHQQFPDKKINIKRVIAEGDLVMAHSNVVLSPDKNISAVHIFQFKGDKIIEMWDCAFPIPENSPNIDGAF